MKKISTLFLAGALVFGLASCNQDKNGGDTPNPATGNTYAGLTVSVKKSDNGLKAGEGDNVPQRDEDGIPVESGISNINIVGGISRSFASKATDGTAISALADGNFAQTAANSGVYQTAAFLTDAGNQDFGVVLNHINSVATGPTVKTFVYGAPASMVADIAATTGDDAFPMTSKFATKNIVADVAKDAVADESSNNFAFDVERIVAQGIVQLADDVNYTAADGKVLDGSLYYAAINGATSTYYMADNAGTRTLDTSLQYPGLKSSIDAETFANGEANAAKKLVRLGDVSVTAAGATPTESEIATALGGYARKPLQTKDYAGADKAAGIYFFENSHAEDLDRNNKNIGFYRLAYAKVYATWIPANVYKLSDTAEATFVPAPDSKIWWIKRVDTTDPAGAKTTYHSRTISDGTPTTPALDNSTSGITEEWVEGRVAYTVKDGENLHVRDTSYDGLTTTGKTFYIGEDGVAYSSVAAAQAASYAVDQTFQKFSTYTDGKSAYRALWNRQVDTTTPTNVVNAETRRNNIYHLTVSGFLTVGMPWDKSDPNDPYLPKPNDPDENDNPHNDDPNIEKQQGYMAVQATVLKWNFVARQNIILGN